MSCSFPFSDALGKSHRKVQKFFLRQKGPEVVILEEAAHRLRDERQARLGGFRASYEPLFRSASSLNTRNDASEGTGQLVL